MFSAVANWNRANVRLDTVFDPATKAPRAPIHGARTGQAGPATAAAPSASVSGIEANPVVFSSAPELIRMRTSGSANSSATAAPASWRPDTAHDVATWRPFIRCRP